MNPLDLIGEYLAPPRTFDEVAVDLVNAFCPTGQGGGVDPTCSPGGSEAVNEALKTPGLTKVQIAKIKVANPGGPVDGVLRIPKGVSQEQADEMQTRMPPGVRVERVNLAGAHKLPPPAAPIPDPPPAPKDDARGSARAITRRQERETRAVPQAPVSQSRPGYAKHVAVIAKGNRHDRIVEDTKAVMQDLHDRHPSVDALLGPTKPTITMHQGNSVPGRRNTPGMYLPGADKLYVAWGKSAQSNSDLQLGGWTAATGPNHTFRHEMGHAVHVRAMRLPHTDDRSDVAFSRAVREAAGNQGTTQFVSSRISQYAATNMKETFAESFAAFTHPRYRSDLPKPIHDYFTRLLK
jgi:hypothetical protein